MINKQFKVHGGQFYSVSFGLRNVAKLKNNLREYGIESITLAFAKYLGIHPLNEENNHYFLSGVAFEHKRRYNLLIKGRNPSLFHITGSSIDLVIVQQEVTNMDSYHIDDVYIIRPRQDGSGNSVVSHEGYGVKPKEDYVEGRMGVIEGTNPKDFSELEEAIRESCTFIKDKAAEQLHYTLKNSTKESPVPASMLSGK